MAPAVVLVVDSDLGLIVSLSFELHSRGIESLPALTTGEAQSMMMDLRVEPDFLVINCGVRCACIFVDDMARLRPGLPMIGIVSGLSECKDCADLLAATFRDSEAKDPERIPYFAGVIEERMRGRRI
jgi:hypothetical protein